MLFFKNYQTFIDIWWEINYLVWNCFENQILKSKCEENQTQPIYTQLSFFSL